MEFLCEIEDVFEITGRGCIVLPGVPRSLGVKAGARISIETPDGRQFETSIAGIEMINRAATDHTPFLVRTPASKAMLPLGSRVYVVAAGP